MIVRQGFALLALSLCMAGAGCTSKSTESPNTLYTEAEEKFKGLDPAHTEEIYSHRLVRCLYEGLVSYSYLKRPFVLEADLAEAMPQISADRRTYTFKLRKGVLFHDDPSFKETGGKGRELGAEDFIYSWKRVADPKTTSTGWWIFDGWIVGLNEWRDEAAKAGTTDYAKPIEGLKALDRYTLQVKLVKPSAQFLYRLAQSYALVLPREAVEMYGVEMINHAVGTGPFRVQEFNGASKAVLVRNPTYRTKLYPSEGEPGDKALGLLEDAGKPLPFLDKIVMTVHTERQPMWLNFLSGKLDFAAAPKDSFDTIVGPDRELKAEFKAKGMRLSKNPEPEFTKPFVFNMTDPVLGKNKALRQAIALSNDMTRINQLFYNNRALLAQGPIPPGITGYDPALKNPYRQYNLAKARDLMAKAGYPDGKGLEPLVYNTLSDSLARQWTENYQKELAEIGVKLDVKTYTWPELQAAVKKKRGQIFGGTSWTADYPDAENLLMLFYCKNSPPGPNDGSYCNPEYDKMYERSLDLGDTPERAALYRKMVDILVEDVPVVVGAHRVTYNFVHPWLKNFKKNSFDPGYIRYLRIDNVAKAAAAGK